MTQDTLPLTHPLVRCLRQLSGQIDSVEGVDPAYLPATEKAEVLIGLSRQIARLEGMRLKVLASADDVAADAGCRSAGAWLAAVSRADGREGRRWQLSLGHVEVIIQALDALPPDVGPDARQQAEQRLLADAHHFTPGELRVLGRRVLELVAPDAADDQEGRALEREERRARDRMRLVTRDLGNGLSRAVVEIPTLSMELWLTQLHAFASPRRGHLEVGGPGRDPDTGARVGHAQRLAQAFCTMLERVPGEALTTHGGDATTFVVTIDQASLEQGVGAARLSSGGRLSISETRRLACNSGILPMVLGGTSQPLDVGRKRRLFQPAQRKALAVRYRECRAAGCDMPAAWCEAHHLTPWSRGGRTDLADGVLLCSFHHHRAHDQRYDQTRLPGGDVRFHRRR